MRLRNVPGAREEIDKHPLCIQEDTPRAGSWHTIFGNEHPIRIEIGMGKGQFLTTLALQNPEINYVGIEKFSSVLVRALEKADAISEKNAENENPTAGAAKTGTPSSAGTPAPGETASGNPAAPSETPTAGATKTGTPSSAGTPAPGEPSAPAEESVLSARQDSAETVFANLRFLRMEAEDICSMFAPGEVDRIYLNFSDPWPKDRHAKRRLTSRRFLERYDRILKVGGRVEFKTDNTDLFEFSLAEAAAAGWSLDACTRDLHHTPELMAGNILTEYEAKFSAEGNAICKLVMHHAAVPAAGTNADRGNNDTACG